MCKVIHLIVHNYLYYKSTINQRGLYPIYKNPSPDHSFGPMGMKLGMDTPLDPAGDLG